MMKKTLLGISTVLLLWFGRAFASPDRFLVEVSNNPMILNEAVDLTIKAVDKNGNILKSFVWDALLTIKWIDEGKYTLPNGWIVNFNANNQWEVKFHKGIIFKQVGKATILAEDIIDDALFGKIDVEIKDPAASTALKKITIVTPVAWWTETNKNINIIWNATDLPNSPLQVLIDGRPQTSSSTNEKGEFSVYVNDLTIDQHILTVQITNAAGTVIAKSDEINFNVSDLANELYKSIKADPSTTVAESEKITLTMTTAPEVSTVELVILWQSYYMEKQQSGIFEKKLKFNTANPSIQIDAKLTANGNTKSYTNIEKLTITPAATGATETKSEVTETEVTAPQADENSLIKITSIRSIYDAMNKKYMISRTVEWNPSRYLVLLSKDKETIKDNPELIQTTVDKQLMVTPPSNANYYLQVYAADETSNPIGEPSEIIMLTAPDEYKPSAPTCIVDAISLSDALIAGKHFLVWNKQAWVERYIVYQSSNPDASIDQMSKVGETSESKFEFAFDEEAKEPMYNYFAVQWVCADGQTTNMSGSTKVQVWPWNIALYLALVVWFISSSYMLIQKQEL